LGGKIRGVVLSLPGADLDKVTKEWVSLRPLCVLLVKPKSPPIGLNPVLISIGSCL
jgi:hypothetical protein